MRHLILGFVTLVLPLAVGVNVRAATILLTDTENELLNDQTVATLESFGHTVTIGPPYYLFDGSVDLTAVNAVLLTNSWNWNSGDMPTTGQDLLLDFVANGSGLVTSEWIIWATGAPAHFVNLQSAFPVLPESTVNSRSPITYSVATPDAILNAGVADPFPFDADSHIGTDTMFNPKGGATVFYHSSPDPNYPNGVIGWDYGLGRVISFSTVMGTSELSDPNYSRLVSNAMNWATIPEPSTLVLLSIGAVGFLAYAWPKRRRA